VETADLEPVEVEGGGGEVATRGEDEPTPLSPVTEERESALKAAEGSSQGGKDHTHMARMRPGSHHAFWHGR
jgi:hypothetical protein